MEAQEPPEPTQSHLPASLQTSSSVFLTESPQLPCDGSSWPDKGAGREEKEGAREEDKSVGSSPQMGDILRMNHHCPFNSFISCRDLPSPTPPRFLKLY